jgi:hypothetical protein
MGIDVTSIDQLDADLVAQLQAEFSQLVQERHPEIELTTGVFHDLVSYFAGGISGAINQTEISRVFQSGSLLSIEENPELADDALVDRVLANYRIDRKTGTAAAGEVSITVTQDVTVIIAANSVFSASGQNYINVETYTARPTTGTITGPNDRILNPNGDGTFTFAIPLSAVLVGEGGNIRRGTQLVPDTPPSNFLRANANTDFVGGVDTELNADLIERLNQGIAAKVMQGRVNIEALIKEQTAFINTLDYSVIGYGNPEMERDQHSIFPVSMGGRVDIYSRTNPLPVDVALVKEATYVGEVADGGVWQFSLARTDAPGFYEVAQIILPSDPVDTGGFEITSDVRGFDLGDDVFVPDLISVKESAYTRYQTAVIQFVDTVTPTTGLVVGTSKQDYNVAVTTMPLIEDLQIFCGGSDVRNLASDVAVKAAVPCFLTVNFEIQKGPESQAPDLQPIITDIANVVNNLGFPGQLHMSTITDVVHNYLEDRQAVGNFDMQGRIRRPDGTWQLVRMPPSDDVLKIPDDPGNLVTGNTTVFILNPENIGISNVTGGFAVGV